MAWNQLVWIIFHVLPQMVENTVLDDFPRTHWLIGLSKKWRRQFGRLRWYRGIVHINTMNLGVACYTSFLDKATSHRKTDQFRQGKSTWVVMWWCWFSHQFLPSLPCHWTILTWGIHLPLFTGQCKRNGMGWHGMGAWMVLNTARLVIDDYLTFGHFPSFPS